MGFLGKLVLLSISLACTVSAAQTPAPMPPIVVLAATEDAEGVTQEDFNLELLRALESRTKASLREKMKAYLRTQGASAAMPNIKTEAHYLLTDNRKLAVVRVKAKGTVGQVFVFGVVGPELRRVACARTVNVDEGIPLSYGVCGRKIRETFDVNWLPED